MPECITRTKRGHFRAPNGRRLSPEDIKRAKSLGIPPAYTDVCVRLNPRAKLQATATGAKGIKQYFYNKTYVAQQQKKRGRRAGAIDGNAILKRTENIIRTGLRDPSTSVHDRKWRSAVALRLIAMSGIRSGSPEYYKANGSVGAMTLRKKHVSLSGGSSVKRTTLAFPGKSGVRNNLSIKDPWLHRAFKILVKHAKGTDSLLNVRRENISSILKEHDSALKLKDLRTCLAMRLYQKFQEKIKTKRPTLSTKALEKAALEATAKQLGHTPSVCKKYYLL